MIHFFLRILLFSFSVAMFAFDFDFEIFECGTRSIDIV